MPIHKKLRYLALIIIAIGVAGVPLFLKRVEQHQSLTSPPVTKIIVTMKKTPDPNFPPISKAGLTNGEMHNVSKIGQIDEKMHDTSGSPTTITESGKVTGTLPTGLSLITSPSLGVDFIAPAGHSLKQGDAVCLTFQRFPNGAIANPSLTEGNCKK